MEVIIISFSTNKHWVLKKKVFLAPVSGACPYDPDGVLPLNLYRHYRSDLIES